MAGERKDYSIDELKTGILSRDTVLLAKAITLVESQKPTHQTQAQELLSVLLPHTGNSIRVGITGVPGVGKSTTIENLGLNLTKAGHRVAVLAVDPSSSRGGGSILGDKTRMQDLSVEPNAFIRPSPTSGTLGGVTKKTRETMALCEAAGFDIILVETVGVGQSETAVAEMVDFFLCLMLPGAGDELQGIKKGVLEIADMIAVNKADGDNETAALKAASEYRAALHILTPQSKNWSPPVVTISGLKNLGLDKLWDQILAYQKAMRESDEWDEKRSCQAVKWMHEMIEEKVLSQLKNDDEIIKLIETLENEVKGGKQTPSSAAASVYQKLGLEP